MSCLDDLMARRRTTRSFGARPLQREDLTALLWAAHGRGEGGHRTVPSAHALYPVDVTVVVGDVDGMSPGIRRHPSTGPSEGRVASGDHRAGIAATALVDEVWIREAPVLLVLTADIVATNEHFAEQPPHGPRGERYVWLEAGHISQNVYLRATELGLGAALVAGLDDEALCAHRPAVVPAGHAPLGLIAVGHRA